MRFRFLLPIIFIVGLGQEEGFAQLPAKIDSSEAGKNSYPLCSVQNWTLLESCCGNMETVLRDVGFLVDVLPDSSVILHNVMKPHSVISAKLIDTRSNENPNGYILYYKEKIGFLSGDLKCAIPPQFDKITGYKANRKYFILHKEGRMVMAGSNIYNKPNSSFKYLYPDHGDYFFAMSDDSLFGIIDNYGNYKIEPKYKSISHYNEKNNCCWTEESLGRWILINNRGKLVNETRFDYPALTKEFTILSENNLKGVLDENLKQLIPFRYTNIKFDKGLFICGWGEFGLEIYRKDGRLLFHNTEEYLRLGDSSIAIKAKGEWHFYLHDTIRVDKLSNGNKEPIDIPISLGLISKKQEEFPAKVFSPCLKDIKIEYLDTNFQYRTVTNNYLLNQFITTSLRWTSEESFWEEERDNKDWDGVLYEEDYLNSSDSIIGFFDQLESNLIILTKDKLVYQPEYKKALSVNEQRHYYRIEEIPQITISVNSLLDNFIELTEEGYEYYNFEITKKHALIVKDSLKCLSLEDILEEPLYKPILNKLFLLKYDSLNACKIPSNQLSELIRQVYYYSFTSDGLCFQYCYNPDVKTILTYKELRSYFKKSKIIKKLEKKYRK